jgi:DNA-binding response OmpR family regulator
MGLFVTKERPVSEVTQWEEQERFHQAQEAIAAHERTVRRPANDDNPLLRVLIIDDHRVSTDTLSLLATLWGHDVRRAYDGVTGLALAAAYRPDVLLLDILMPNLSGFEVAMQVRRQDRLKNCFIIAVTGRSEAKHRCRCYESGVDLVLTKPVAPSHMQTLLMLESEHALSRREGKVAAFGNTQSVKS